MREIAVGCVIALATWYGKGELGQRHAASWHGMTPEGMPEVVTLEHFGVAAPFEYAFGTRLKITRIRSRTGEGQQYDGRSVIVTVVDRIGRVANKGCHFDLWPAPARILGIGPAFGLRDAGIIEVKVERVVEHDCFRWEGAPSPSEIASLRLRSLRSSQ